MIKFSKILLICLAPLVLYLIIAGHAIRIFTAKRAASYWISSPNFLYHDRYLYVRKIDGRVMCEINRNEEDPEYRVFVEGKSYGDFMKLEDAKSQAEKYAH